MTGMILGALLALQAGGLIGDLGLGGAAASPVTTQPLAVNEVLLETSATAFEAAPADRATFTVTLTGKGETRPAAEAARDRISRAVTAAARSVGARDTDVESNITSASRTTLMLPPMVRSTDVDEPAETYEEDKGIVTTGTMSVTIRGADNIRRFRAAIPGTGAEIAGTPQLDLTDDSAIRRAARSKALASARADAEAYAASLNMRVARVLRISERTGGDLLGLISGALGAGNRSQIERAFKGDAAGEVPVIVFLGVDFALAPR